MNISRHASQRYRGTDLLVRDRTLTFDPANWFHSNLKWDSHSHQLVISSNYNMAPDGQTHHDYKIQFSQQDIAAMLECLAHAARANPAEFAQPLKRHREALFTLLACASGYALAELPCDEASFTPTVNAIGA